MMMPPPAPDDIGPVRAVPGRIAPYFLGLLLLVLAACAPRQHPPGPVVGKPMLNDRHFIATDGTALPLHRWQPTSMPAKAVIIALHGFNDYGRFFDAAATYLSQRGVLSYALDQRGFGAAPHPGMWAGGDAYRDDVRQLTLSVRARHPDLPLYLLGESMGGAVVLTAMASDTPPDVDGVILSAPAVWGRSVMPWYQTLALELAGHTLPWLTLTGRGLNLQPSDNIEMLRELSRDPLVIKETRIDSVYGLTDLMDRALASAGKLQGRTLLLFGKHDEIIPPDAVSKMVERLPMGEDAAHNRTFAFYETGYHMLLRDLSAEIVWRDIAVWINTPDAPLPSGASQTAADIPSSTR